MPTPPQIIWIYEDIVMKVFGSSLMLGCVLQTLDLKELWVNLSKVDSWQVGLLQMSTKTNHCS